MYLRRAISIFTTKFDLVAKMLIYSVVVVLLLSAVATTIINPVIKEFKNDINDTNIVQSSKQALGDFLKGDIDAYKESSQDMKISYEKLLDLLDGQQNNLNKFYITLILLFLFGKFLFTLSFVPFSDEVNKFMHSKTESNVASSFVTNIKKSLLYSVIDLGIIMPVDILLILLNHLLMTQIYSLIGVFAVPLGLATGIVLLMTRVLITSNTIPAVVYNNVGVWKAFIDSVKTSIPRIKYLLSKYFFLGLFATSLYIIFGLSTLGLGYILGIPMILMIFRVMNLVSYYNSQGYRYYLTPVQIVEPYCIISIKSNK